MPVIINKLSVTIKAGTGKDPNDEKKPYRNESQKMSEVIGKEDIIREAVERVMQILMQKQER